MSPQEWTPYGIFGFRRRWRLNWAALMWLGLDVALWVAAIWVAYYICAGWRP